MRRIAHSAKRKANAAMPALWNAEPIPPGHSAQSATRSSQSDDLLWALKDVNFEVKKGEALGIIGANGSGKTTILRLLAKVTTPTKGTIDVAGKVAPLIQVGAGFHPELTGKENVYLNASIMGLDKKEVDEKYNDIVSFAELERFMDTPVKRYSSGMYVRLGFAVVANINPDIFLIDEILSVGDLSFQRKCLGTMEKIRKSDKTIVFISHNLAAVRGLCERVIWLDKGEIKKIGKVDEVINAYISFVNSKTRQTSNKESLGLGARWGTGEAEIREVNMLDSNYKVNKTFEFNSDVNIQLEFKINERDLKDISVWICIMNDKYEKIFGGISNLSGDFKSQKRYSCNSIIRNISLIPGKYIMIVGLYGNFLNVPYDRWGEAYNFQITSLGDATDYYGVDFHGNMILNLQWLLK